MLGEAVRNCVNRLRSGDSHRMVEMIENIAFLQTRAASVYFLMSIFFPAPPAAAALRRRPVARRYCAVWDKVSADMPHSGISARMGMSYCRQMTAKLSLAAMDLLSLLTIFFERRAAPQSGAARLSGDVLRSK